MLREHVRLEHIGALLLVAQVAGGVMNGGGVRNRKDLGPRREQVADFHRSSSFSSEFGVRSFPALLNNSELRDSGLNNCHHILSRSRTVFVGAAEEQRAAGAELDARDMIGQRERLAQID